MDVLVYGEMTARVSFWGSVVGPQVILRGSLKGMSGGMLGVMLGEIYQSVPVTGSPP